MKWNNLIQSLDPRHGNYWHIAKTLRNKKTMISPIHGKRGLAYTLDDKINSFADTLEDQFTPNYDLIDKKIYQKTKRIIQILPTPTHLDPPLKSVTLEEIKDIIRTFNNKKAPGPDKIPNQAIKLLPLKNLMKLTNIVNSIVRLNYFPCAWKHAHIIQIPKPGKDPTFL